MKLKNFTFPGIASWRAINHAKQKSDDESPIYFCTSAFSFRGRSAVVRPSKRENTKRSAMIKRAETAERGDVARATVVKCFPNERRSIKMKVAREKEKLGSGFSFSFSKRGFSHPVNRYTVEEITDPGATRKLSPWENLNCKFPDELAASFFSFSFLFFLFSSSSG